MSRRRFVVAAAAVFSSALLSFPAYAQQGAAAPDFDGDGKTDFSFYRPSTGTWHVLESSTGTTVVRQWGLTTDIPVPGDYDGDGRADLAVYRRPGAFFQGLERDAAWFVLFSASGYTTSTGAAFGLARDIPTPADYDADGKTDYAVYRGFDWHVLRSRDRYVRVGGPGAPESFYPVPIDLNGDGGAETTSFRRNELRPVHADYDGDGRGDLAWYAPSDGTWSVRLSSSLNVVAYSLGAPSDVPVPGDYDGDGRVDPAVYRRASGTWHVLQSSSAHTVVQSTVFGDALDVPLPHAAVNYGVQNLNGRGHDYLGRDFDGDHIPDITVFRPSTGAWFSLLSRSGFTKYIATASTGRAGDIPFPVAGDDGVGRVGLYRPSDHTWPHLAFSPTQWGLDGDIPVPADYNGDGLIDVTVYRPSARWWASYPFGDGCFQDNIFPRCRLVWGSVDAVPVPGRYLSSEVIGSHRGVKAAVFTPATGVWSLQTTFANITTPSGISYQWGLPGDLPVQADYDGDGRTDIAVYRPSNRVWYFRYSSSEFGGTAAFSWGLDGDIPVPTDYDGDGRSDLAVFRPANGVWYILKSSSNYTESMERQWGLPGDVPIGARQ